MQTVTADYHQAEADRTGDTAALGSDDHQPEQEAVSQQPSAPSGQLQHATAATPDTANISMNRISVTCRHRLEADRPADTAALDNAQAHVEQEQEAGSHQPSTPSAQLYHAAAAAAAADTSSTPSGQLTTAAAAPDTASTALYSNVEVSVSPADSTPESRATAK